MRSLMVGLIFLSAVSRAEPATAVRPGREASEESSDVNHNQEPDAESAPEGERPTPLVFQEFESASPTADSVIFLRSDFNDLIPAKNPVPFRYQIKGEN